MNSDDRAVLALPPDVCWGLLRSTEVGRLAVIVEGKPQIFPVNYAVDGGTIVFRTAPGTKLTALTSSPSVSFEIDGWDELSRDVWSVLVKGTAEVVQGFTQLLDTTNLPVFPWQASSKNQFVRLVAGEVSGRRFRRAPATFWETQLYGVRPQTPE